MTTQLTREANPRLPAPANYTRHVDKILAPIPARPPLPRHVLTAAAVCAVVGVVALVILLAINT